MNRVEMKTYKSKRILCIDFSNMKANELVAVIDTAKQVIAKEPEHSLLILTDLTNMNFDSEAVKALKDYVAHNKPYVKASAVVGGSGLKEIILGSLERTTSRVLKNCDTQQEAQEWLIQAGE